MLMEILILSLIIGKIRDGEIKNLGKVKIKGWYLLFIGFVLEITILLIYSNTNGKPSEFIIDNFFLIQISIYILLILGLVPNIQDKGMKTILIGTILNLIPLMANKGRMPVSKKALEKLGLYSELKFLQSNKILTHVLIDKNMKFYYLADIIPIFRPYCFSRVISIGDILIGLGIFLIIQFNMKKITQNI